MLKKKSLRVLTDCGLLQKATVGNTQPPLHWIKTVLLHRSMSAGCQNYTQLKQTNKTSYVRPEYGTVGINGLINGNRPDYSLSLICQPDIRGQKAPHHQPTWPSNVSHGKKIMERQRPLRSLWRFLWSQLRYGGGRVTLTRRRRGGRVRFTLTSLIWALGKKFGRRPLERV